MTSAASEKQIGYLHRLVEQGLTEAQRELAARQQYWSAYRDDVPEAEQRRHDDKIAFWQEVRLADDLTSQDASALIDLLRSNLRGFHGVARGAALTRQHGERLSANEALVERALSNALPFWAERLAGAETR